MKKVRFAPSPTGSLHVGNALSAVANRAFGDWMLLRIDDTDPARNVPGGEEAILRDLELARRSRGTRGRSGRASGSSATARPPSRSADRFEGTTLLREDGSATYQLATVVDDVDFGITHVVRGNDHRPNEPSTAGCTRRSAREPPEYVHHGLILGEDGKKLSKRRTGATVAYLREAGIPAEAVRAYLEELGLPRTTSTTTSRGIRGSSIEAIGRLSDEELAARVGRARRGRAGPARRARPRRGARVRGRGPRPRRVRARSASPETLERFRELRGARTAALDEADARSIVRELKAVGGDLRALGWR